MFHPFNKSNVVKCLFCVLSGMHCFNILLCIWLDIKKIALHMQTWVCSWIFECFVTVCLLTPPFYQMQWNITCPSDTNAGKSATQTLIRFTAFCFSGGCVSLGAACAPPHARSPPPLLMCVYWCRITAGLKGVAQTLQWKVGLGCCTIQCAERWCTRRNVFIR